MSVLRKTTLFIGSLAFAPLAQASSTVAEAEQVRLADEMISLSQRQAWTGVEQMYLQLQTLDVRLSQADHLQGAQAAWELGDVDACYQRLRAANSAQPTQEVIDWLWKIDNQYGPVDLSTPRSKRAVLLREEPFDSSDQQNSFEAAAASARDDGSFVGLLPSGSYSFAGRRFVVEPGVSFRVEVSGRASREAQTEPKTIHSAPPSHPTESALDDAVESFDFAVESPVLAEDRRDPITSPPEPYQPVAISRVDGDGREPWESVFDTDSSTETFVIEKATITPEADLLRGSSSARTPSIGSRRTGLGRGLGAGLSVLSLASAGYAAHQYTVTASAHQRYLAAQSDKTAAEIWVDEVEPAQQRLYASGILGGVSLVSGSILWLSTSTGRRLEVGVSPRSMHMSARW